MWTPLRSVSATIAITSSRVRAQMTESEAAGFAAAAPAARRAGAAKVEQRVDSGRVLTDRRVHQRETDPLWHPRLEPSVVVLGPIAGMEETDRGGGPRHTTPRDAVIGRLSTRVHEAGTGSELW